MVYSVLGAIGPRAAAAPVALSLGDGGSHLRSSRLHDSTVSSLLRFQEHAASSWANEPKLIITKSKRRKKKSPERLRDEFVLSRFIQIKSQNACLVIHFLTNQTQIKSNEKNIGGVS